MHWRHLKSPSWNYLWIISLQDSVVCKIGCGSRIEVNSPSSTSLTISESKAKATPSIWNRLIWTSKVKDVEGPVSPDPQDVRYGMDVSLGGQLAEVMMFMEPLLELHIESLYKLGEIAAASSFCYLNWECFEVFRSHLLWAGEEWFWGRMGMLFVHNLDTWYLKVWYFGSRFKIVQTYFNFKIILMICQRLNNNNNILIWLHAGSQIMKSNLRRGHFISILLFRMIQRFWNKQNVLKSR